jgi:hypothetical protein
MSIEITVAFVQQYTDNVIMLSQQKGSLLRDTVQFDGNVVGKYKFFERIGATSAVKKTNRHGDTPLVNTPHSRRRATLVPYEWADLVDEPDQHRLLIKPESKYAQNAAWAMGRAMDDEIIGAFYGTSYAGEDGSISVTFPAAMSIAQGSVSLTVAKLRAAKLLLEKGDVDPDEPRFICASPSSIDNLLSDSTVTSSDYNTVKALVQGEIDTFVGFKFIKSNRLPLDTVAATYRAAYAWTKGGVGLGVAQDVKTRITERADKSYSIQVYLSQDIGATRVEEAKVVQIPCLAAD